MEKPNVNNKANPENDFNEAEESPMTDREFGIMMAEALMRGINNSGLPYTANLAPEEDWDDYKLEIRFDGAARKRLN